MRLQAAGILLIACFAVPASAETHFPFRLFQHRVASCDDVGCDVCSSYACDCDALPAEFCDQSEADSGSCIDPWLPRSCVGLPVLKEMAEERGATLPPPLGVGYTVTVLKRTVRVSDISIGLNGGPQESLERFRVNEFDTNSVNQIVRGDVWLLPCLNVYGLVGETRTEGDLVATVDEFPFQVSPSFDIPIRIKLDGLTYGVGGTAAIGTPKYFASMDVNYTRTDFNQLASELYVIVAAPRVGMVIDRPCYKGEIHMGAMYQYAKQTVEVEVDLPSLGDLDVTVTQYEPRKWNFLIGTLWAIDERLHAIVELGAGGRQYVISSLTMRF